MKKISVWQILSSILVFIVGCVSIFICSNLIFGDKEFLFLRPFRLLMCDLASLLPLLFLSDSTGWDYCVIIPIVLLSILLSLLLVLLPIFYYNKKAKVVIGCTIPIIFIDMMMSFVYISELIVFITAIVLRCLILLFCIMSIKHINENYEFY